MMHALEANMQWKVQGVAATLPFLIPVTVIGNGINIY